jgi:RNA recognition motif-containing protein
MGKKLFVGNLSFKTTDDELKQFFSRVGTCESASVVSDRATGRSRGFGFVEMSTDEEAARALGDLNGAELDGRKLTVAEAHAKPGGGGGERGRGPRGSRPGGRYSGES